MMVLHSSTGSLTLPFSPSPIFFSSSSCLTFLPISSSHPPICKLPPAYPHHESTALLCCYTLQSQDNYDVSSATSTLLLAKAIFNCVAKFLVLNDGSVFLV